MFQEVYEKLENKKKHEVLFSLEEALKPAHIDEENMTVIRCPIDFYPEHNLYEIVDNKVMPPLQRFFVTDKKHKNIHTIDYNSECIYQLNDKAGLFITEENITEYIKFFFNFSRGQHGRFLILNTVDDIQWQEEPPLAARRAIASMITPISVSKISQDGSYLCNACFIFKDSLVNAAVKVFTNGKIEISDEEILVEDMPIMDDSLGL